MTAHARHRAHYGPQHRARPGTLRALYSRCTRPGPWVDQAACADHPNADLWFPLPNGRGNEAKAICRGCPVRAECAAYALAQPSLAGVWGGLSEREREELQRRNRRASR